MMGKLLIEITYNDHMKMSVNQMEKNIKYVLTKHFEDMASYTTVSLPVIEVKESHDD
jgi:hypothetical protein